MSALLTAFTSRTFSTAKHYNILRGRIMTRGTINENKEYKISEIFHDKEMNASFIFKL